MIDVDEGRRRRMLLYTYSQIKFLNVRKTELLNNHDIKNYDNLIVAAKKSEILEDGFHSLKHVDVLVCATY